MIPAAGHPARGDHGDPHVPTALRAEARRVQLPPAPGAVGEGTAAPGAVTGSGTAVGSWTGRRHSECGGEGADRHAQVLEHLEILVG
jgi:hypothetical protein